MYIRLAISDGIIDGYKKRDICEAFNNNIESSFEQREQYDEYYYKYPVDVEINENHILQLTDKGYSIFFRNDTVDIK